MRFACSNQLRRSQPIVLLRKCVCPKELAATQRNETDVRVGHYCNRSIYFIYPGRDGWSAPSGHTHTSTYMEITSNDRVSRVVSQQQEGRSKMIITCVPGTVCMHLPSLSLSQFLSPSLVTFCLFLLPPRLYPPFPSISLSPLSPAASEIHESVVFPRRLQHKMKKAMVSSTKVRTCSRHPVPEEMTVTRVCVCVCG